MNLFGKATLITLGGAYGGNWAYNKWLSPKIAAGIGDDLARAATVTVTIVVAHMLLKGKG